MVRNVIKTCQNKNQNACDNMDYQIIENTLLKRSNKTPLSWWAIADIVQKYTLGFNVIRTKIAFWHLF